MSESFYVDDLVSKGDSSNDAYALYIKAKNRMEQGGFNLRKWLPNDAQLRDKICDVNPIAWAKTVRIHLLKLP